MALNSAIFCRRVSSGTRKCSARQERQKNSSVPRLMSFFVRAASSFVRIAPQRAQRPGSVTGGYQSAQVQLHIVPGNVRVEIVRLQAQVLAGKGVPHLQREAGGNFR